MPSIISSPPAIQASSRTPILKPRPDVDFKGMASLSTIKTKGFLKTPTNDSGAVVIYIPHLPEDIELNRENTYDNIGSNPTMPDGLWIYQYTSPLELGLAFTLHAYDALCIEGSNTLLDIAAKLHSMELPASNDLLLDNSSSLSANISAAKGAAVETQNRFGASPDSNDPNQAPQTSYSQFKYPPACSLKLIQAGASGFGVNCVGLVKSVGVTLHGPYRKTVNSGSEFNLPSAATYKFTFVHNPSYTNDLSSTIKFVNATSPDIYAYFYNTAHLASLTGNSYSDVEGLNTGRAVTAP